MGEEIVVNVHDSTIPIPTNSTSPEETHEVSTTTKTAKPTGQEYDYPKNEPYEWGMSGNIPPPPFHKRQVGRMYVYLEKKRKDGTPKFLCILGPCWPMFLVTQLLILGISIPVYILYLPELPLYVSIPAILLLIFTCLSLFMTGITDPGIQQRYNEPQGALWTWNDNAKSYRPQGVLYEHESQVLVKQVDHFCPWTGTVIAKGNMKFFLMFTRSICFLICAVLGIAMVGIMSNSGE